VSGICHLIQDLDSLLPLTPKYQAAFNFMHASLVKFSVLLHMGFALLTTLGTTSTYAAQAPPYFCNP
jgi:hypothetical protein